MKTEISYLHALIAWHLKSRTSLSYLCVEFREIMQIVGISTVATHVKQTLFFTPNRLQDNRRNDIEQIDSKVRLRKHYDHSFDCMHMYVGLSWNIAYRPISCVN
jgi:hypothetical protein